MFCEISGPLSLSHAAYTERSTIVDLLIKIPGRDGIYYRRSITITITITLKF